MIATVRRARRLDGDITVPGDKSISHRALILGSIADGESHVRGLSNGADVRSTAGCMRALGVEIDDSGLITAFWEKPEDPRGNLCNAGLYVFRREVETYLPTAFPSDVGRSLLPALVGHAVGLPIRDYFADIGTLENYHRAQVDYAHACRAAEVAC